MNFLKKINPQVFRIQTWGGLGDGLLITPLFKALKEKYPHSKIKVYYVNHLFKDIYFNNPYIDSAIKVRVWHLLFKRFFKVYDTHFQFIPPTFLAEKKHVKEIVADMFSVKLKDKRLQVYLTFEEEMAAREIMSQFKKPICIHVTSRNSKYHVWAHENWEELIRRMPEYTFIQLGQGDEYPIEGAVDFRGKTSVRSAIGMIKYAKFFVGIEASLAHAANATETPTIVIFNDSDIDAFGHKEHVNLHKPVACAPCYYLLWGQNGCPYDAKCTKTITIDQVQEAILKLENKIFFQERVQLEEMLN